MLDRATSEAIQRCESALTSPPVGPPRRGTITFVYREEDASAAPELTFEIDYERGVPVAFRFVEGLVWFGDVGLKINPFGFNDDRAPHVAAWFESRYCNVEWLRDEVNRAIAEDMGG